MLKWLRLLAIPVLIAAVILVTRHYKDYDTGPKGYDARCVQENQSSLAVGSLVCSIEASQDAEAGKPHPQWWYKLLSWPEGVTAWAVLLTLYAIVWQSWETRRAADATRDAAQAALKQSDIQAAAMQQWVDVDATDCTAQKWRAATGFPFVVDLGFQAVNNTSNVLTITKIETTLNESPDETEVFRIEANAVLSTHKDSESNSYPFYIPTQYIPADRFAGGAIITLNGEVTFIDCLGTTRTQYFGGVYSCAEGYIKKLQAKGIVPDRLVKPGMYLPGHDGEEKPDS